MKKDRQKSKRKKKNKFSTIIVLAVIFISVTFTIKLVDQKKSLNQLKAEKANYESQMTSLNNEIEELKEDYDKKDSMEFVEKIAREKLGMVKSQEIVVIEDEEDKEEKEKNESNKSNKKSKSVKTDKEDKKDN